MTKLPDAPVIRRFLDRTVVYLKGISDDPEDIRTVVSVLKYPPNVEIGYNKYDIPIVVTFLRPKENAINSYRLKDIWHLSLGVMPNITVCGVTLKGRTVEFREGVVESLFVCGVCLDIITNLLNANKAENEDTLESIHEHNSEIGKV